MRKFYIILDAMNLNKWQIKALVQEIYPQVMSAQRSKLDYISASHKDYINNELDIMCTVDFNLISWDVKEVSIKVEKYEDHFGIHSHYVSSCWVKNREELVQWIYDKTIQNAYTDKFWKEVTRDMIEQKIILHTIDANNIEDITSAVIDSLT